MRSYSFSHGNSKQIVAFVRSFSCTPYGGNRRKQIVKHCRSQDELFQKLFSTKASLGEEVCITNLIIDVHQA